MGRHAKTQALIDTACEILAEAHPMTVRQVYYQLVSRQVIENTLGRYQAVSNALVDARKEGLIPWDWIEDRLRRPRHVSMWGGLADFARMAEASYRRDVWEAQPGYLEVWVEKDALSGIFGNVLNPYGVTLNVGRGYDGWDSIHNAAMRYTSGGEAPAGGVTVLYFGDFDPSGEDMHRSLIERLGFFGCHPEVLKVALTLEDVRRYDLPPALTKDETRRAKFVERFGDIAVELDALPVGVLRERIESEVRSRMDLAALDVVRRQEAQERARLGDMLRGA